MLVFCTPFSTRPDRIEKNQVRTLAVVYENVMYPEKSYPEGAPGDTIHAKIYCAGDSTVSISWSVSWDVVKNAYGTDTFLNVQDLPQFRTTSHLPDSLDFYFVVPDTVFYNAHAVQVLLNLVRDSLPPGMRTMSQRELALLVNDFSKIDMTNPAALGTFWAAWGSKIGTSPDSALIAVAPLLGAFSTMSYFFADVKAVDGKHLTVKSDFIVRYNTKFASIPSLSAIAPVNTNPRIRWLGIYIVKGRSTGFSMFSPFDTTYAGKWKLQYLYNELNPDSVQDTVVIDAGYSYYIAADSGMVSFMRHDTLVTDTSRDKYYLYKTSCVTKANNDTTINYVYNGTPSSISIKKDGSKCFVEDNRIVLETFYYDWLYQNLALDSVSLPLDSLVVLTGMSNPIASMLPSMDTHMTEARFWVVVTDSYLGQFNRPVGICYREAICHFTYTDAYRTTKARN
jgi:hypothetical protein